MSSSPHQVDAYLAEPADAAVFEQIAGLVVARPYGYDPDQTRRLWSMVAGRTEAWAYPCSATWSAATGVRARVDATTKTFETLESALRPDEQTAPRTTR